MEPVELDTDPAADHAGFSTGLYPELLRLNKKTHLEVMEARSKYLHLFLDQCSFDTDPSPRKAAPPYQTQPGFKSLIVSCTFDEWTKNEVLGPPIEADITCLPLRYKIGDLIILEDEAPIPRDWHHDRKHLRFFDLVSERHVQRLMIAPRVTLTDRNHPAQIDQWIEEYGFDDLSSEKRDKLKLSIVEVSIPRLPGVDSRDIQQPAKQAREVRVVRISLKQS